MEKVNRTRKILEKNNIDIEKLVSPDPEVQEKEVEKFIIYLKNTGMTDEQVEDYLTNLKVEFLNLVDEKE